MAPACSLGQSPGRTRFICQLFRFDTRRPVGSTWPLSAESERAAGEFGRGFHRMNKNDLISAVADSSGLSRTDAARAVEAVFDCISAALGQGEEVRLVGFGTFTVANRKASTGRNPR